MARGHFIGGFCFSSGIEEGSKIKTADERRWYENFDSPGEGSPARDFLSCVSLMNSDEH
jgi:hypothetical protein